MNNIIYDYFEINFGLVNSTITTQLNKKYKAYSKHERKSILKQLKSNGSDPAVVKAVAHFLRCKLNTSQLHLNEGEVDQKLKETVGVS